MAEEPEAKRHQGKAHRGANPANELAYFTKVSPDPNMKPEQHHVPLVKLIGGPLDGQAIHAHPEQSEVELQGHRYVREYFGKDDPEHLRGQPKTSFEYAAPDNPMGDFGQSSK